MLQPLAPQPTTPLLKQIAKFTERRQEVLAGNIANIDTPGYRLRDLPTSEFRQALARAVANMKLAPIANGSDFFASPAHGSDFFAASSNGGDFLAPPGKGGLGGVDELTTLFPELTPPIPPSPRGGEDELFPDSLFQAQTPLEQPGITFNDGNNRSIEHQFLEMTKNSLWQNFALELLRGQFDQLQAVISERA